MASTVIGDPFVCEEHRVADVLAGLGPYLAIVNDPPWAALAPAVRPPTQVVVAHDMDVDHLDRVAAAHPDAADVVVGLGGGTALDTAKYVAWRRSLPLVQIPSITSVDAAFTDAVGVRVDRRVRYVGRVVPRLVVLDVELITAAPRRLNRAGIGDVLSCHTALHDWRLASATGGGPAWDDALAALGRRLLDEMSAAVADIAAVSPVGVRFLADAYRRIGAACAAAGHSRFEEGSEHHWAYAYEHATGIHQVHGELVSLGVVALAHVQGNDPDRARSLVAAAGTVAHPADLGITRADFCAALTGLRDYARSERLDPGIAELADIDDAVAGAAWAFADTLPRAAP